MSYKPHSRAAQAMQPHVPAQDPVPAAPLTAEQIETARQTRNAVQALAPEFVPFIKGLVEAGMISGWRDVRCRPIEKPSPQKATP